MVLRRSGMVGAWSGRGWEDQPCSVRSGEGSFHRVLLSWRRDVSVARSHLFASVHPCSKRTGLRDPVYDHHTLL